MIRKLKKFNELEEIIMQWDDLDYLRYAYAVASECSTDPNTQNGAILISPKDGMPVAQAANHFPYGVEEKEERWEKPLKYRFVEHAERNVIYKAARYGVSTFGLIMYCPWFSCADCARAIVQSGIAEVIGHNLEIHKTQTHWLEEIKIAEEILTEGGVKFKRVNGKVGKISIKFAGEIIEP